MNNTSIGITFLIENEKIDLQIPNQVTFDHLKTLLVNSLVLLEINLPDKFEFQIINKPLQIVEDSLISDYPLSNGDQIKILKTI